MNVLHICSYYIRNDLYQKLICELSKNQKLNQTLYIPIKDKKFINKNILESENLTFYYDNILLKRDRILYKTKITKQLKRVELLVGNLKTIEFIHAHTLFSDGGTAYLFKKKYGIKYMVNIRATDINIFYKYGIHLRNFMKKVLLDAEFIVFISQAYKDKVVELIPNSILDKIEHKMHVIPNGIDQIWFNKQEEDSNFEKKHKIKLIFTGLLDKNKNLQTVLDVLEELNKNEKKFFLNIIGDGPLLEPLKKYAIKKGIITDLQFHRHVNQGKLVKIMDESDIFILPSFQETFGISYIEAMSRGVPVIYTKKQGIDGLFKEGQVGYSVNPTDVKSIIRNIHLITENYSCISKECERQAKSYSWDKISLLYEELYRSVHNILDN